MNRVDKFLTKYFFLFPIIMLLSNLNGFYGFIQQYYWLVILPNAKTTGLIVAAQRIDAVNGTAYDCTVEYAVSGQNYSLFGSISYDDRPGVKVKDTVTVRYNVKNPYLASFDLVGDLTLLFVVSIVIILWSLYGVALIFIRLKNAIDKISK